MKVQILVRRSLLIALAVSGCMRELRPPPVQELRLGTKVAPYRAYVPGTLCRADLYHQDVLQRELRAMNELLAAFLEGTSSGPEGVWESAQVEVLASARTGLLPALDTYEATLRQTEECDFESRHGIAELARSGLEQVRLSRQRVEEAEALLHRLQARAELKSWKERQLVEQETERATWCPTRPRSLPDIYFALEDETGRTEWLFCDGSRVVDVAGEAPPTYVPPRNGRPASRSVQAALLRAAARYPQSQIRHAPRLPPPASSATEEPTPPGGSAR